MISAEAVSKPSVRSPKAFFCPHPPGSAFCYAFTMLMTQGATDAQTTARGHRIAHVKIPLAPGSEPHAALRIPFRDQVHLFLPPVILFRRNRSGATGPEIFIINAGLQGTAQEVRLVRRKTEAGLAALSTSSSCLMAREQPTIKQYKQGKRREKPVCWKPGF